MANLEILHFEQLKTEVQAQFLQNNTPSNEEISKWKGIDIIYFQEDLRKTAKGNISEKSFYTYFKTSPVSKLPRIDMLNLLSIYAGYASWYDFKKNHLFAGEILSENENSNEEEVAETIEFENSQPIEENTSKIVEKQQKPEGNSSDLQKSSTENQPVNKKSDVFETYDTSELKPRRKSIRNYFWGALTSVLAIAVGLLGFSDKIFDTTYTYCFTDLDRNAPIQTSLDIKVIKEDESPIYYRVKPGECFYYPTKEKNLKMVISSPFYENLDITRNLVDAPKDETIQLKPDDYKMAVYYFSKKVITGNPDESLNLIKQKRRELENRISDNAVIYQVFDSDIYGIETLDKQKYINLVTTPTTSLKNLTVIEMKSDKGKIVSIKFKINDDDE